MAELPKDEPTVSSAFLFRGKRGAIWCACEQRETSKERGDQQRNEAWKFCEILVLLFLNKKEGTL